MRHSSDINFHDYLNVIKNRRRIAAVFFFAVVAVVTIGSFLVRPVYRAAVALLIDLEAPNVLTTTDAVSLGGGTNYYTYREYLQSQQEIIKSRSIALGCMTYCDFQFNSLKFSRLNLYVFPTYYFVYIIIIKNLWLFNFNKWYR